MLPIFFVITLHLVVLLQTEPVFSMATEKEADRKLEFGFRAYQEDNGSIHELAFKHVGGKTLLGIVCHDHFPTYFESLKDFLIRGSNDGRPYWAFVKGGVLPLEFPRFSVYTGPQKVTFQPQNNFLECAAEDLAHIVKDKSLIFYTGAGISALRLHTLDQVYKELGFDPSNLKRDQECIALIERVLNSTDTYIAYMDHFFNVCLNGTPTPAHQALSTYLKSYPATVCTENLDQFHEKTGINPLKRRDFLKNFSKVYPKYFASADHLIVIGVAASRSVLIRRLKRTNPHLKIILFDRDTANALCDYLIPGDLQETVPAFLDALVRLKTG